MNCSLYTTQTIDSDDYDDELMMTMMIEKENQ